MYSDVIRLKCQRALIFFSESHTKSGGEFSYCVFIIVSLVRVRNFVLVCRTTTNIFLTRMHSSRMRTARSLTVSHRILHMPPQEKPHMPPWEQPCMPPREQPCTHTLGKTMPPREQPCMPPGSNHTHPRSNHACPPGSNHTCPPRSNHAHPPRGTTYAPPPVNRITDACENITFANYVCGR